MDVERIPDEVLEAAFRKLCRKLAAVIVQGMAITDTSFSDIDARLGWKPGRAQRTILGFINAKSNSDLRKIADLALAMKCEIEFRLVDARPVEEINEGQNDSESQEA